MLKVRGQDSQALVTHIKHGEIREAAVRRVFEEGASWRFKSEYAVDVYVLGKLARAIKAECLDDTDALGPARSLSL